MTTTMHLGLLLGWVAAALSLASFLMRSMVPLRYLALASNVFFVAYGYLEAIYPALALHSALLPLNAQRIWEIHKVSKAIAAATGASPVSEWLLPRMHVRAFRAGDTLFRRGDPAHELFYIARGRVRLEEAGQVAQAGELLGEIGLFAPDRRRTQTVVCETDGELYWMSDEMMFRLYYQSPKLGFYLMRLATERLLRDVQRQQARAAAAPAPA